MKQVFEMVPAGAGVGWFWVAMIALFALILGLFCYMAWSMQQVRFELDGGQLHLRGDLWARSIPTHSLRVAQAQIVDLRNDRQLRPRRKTMGSNLPGYKSGWFRLANGEKALLYVTDESRVVHVPTDEGYALLLSAKEPERFLQALRGDR